MFRQVYISCIYICCLCLLKTLSITTALLKTETHEKIAEEFIDFRLQLISFPENYMTHYTFIYLLFSNHFITRSSITILTVPDLQCSIPLLDQTFFLKLVFLLSTSYLLKTSLFTRGNRQTQLGI